MLDLIGFSLVGFLMQLLGQESGKLPAASLVSWQEAAIFAIATEPDLTAEKIVADYLSQLAAQGLANQQQKIWIQSEWAELVDNQGKIPASAASLTKVATSLAAVEKLGLNHQFETRIYATGVIQNGVLQGDLVIEGSGDPLFVWEEAITLGNAINNLGIRQVTGNLIINGDFYINFRNNSEISGELLKIGLDSRLWSSEVKKQAESLPPNTPRPQVAIAGTIQLQESLPANSQLLLRHQSLKVFELIKQMNIYSNNAIAEMLAQSVGGTEVVANIARQAARLSPEDIQLINGSGLGVDNRISPRAVCQIFMALEDKLKSQGVSVADLFPVAGHDHLGTMQWRSIPEGITVKTGTLAQVSALAGVIPTEERGLVWFAIMNQGSNIEMLRSKQDQLLQRLAQHWKLTPFAPSNTLKSSYLGDPTRNLKSVGR